MICADEFLLTRRIARQIGASAVYSSSFKNKYARLPYFCAFTDPYHMEFPSLPGDTPDALVSFHFEDVAFDFPHARMLEEWLLGVADTEGKAFIEVNYIFCSDERLREINVEFLDHDYYTDVITFPYSEGAVHGDIFISSERVADNAKTLGVSFAHELCRVIVHGVLHLAGYSDKTPEQENTIRAKEDFYLSQIASSL